MTAADEYQRLLDEHLPVFECDGDYGEMQWVECSCGSEYFVDTDAGYNEHRAHVAQALAADPGVRAAVEREARAEAWDEGASANAETQARLMYEDGPQITNPYRQEPTDERR